MGVDRLRLVVVVDTSAPSSARLLAQRAPHKGAPSMRHSEPNVAQRAPTLFSRNRLKRPLAHCPFRLRNKKSRPPRLDLTLRKPEYNATLLDTRSLTTRRLSSRPRTRADDLVFRPRDQLAFRI